MLGTQRITELAEAVADGRPADWESAEHSASDDDGRETIAKLKDVASIGQLFAGLSSGPGDERARRPRLATPTTWGGLRVLEHVGRGRFGDVYRAWDPALDREVALKLVEPCDGDQTVETQVVEEGRLMARVRHPHVVTIHGAQRIDGVTGLWMEFVEGRTLAAELADAGPFDAEQLVHVGIELCQALAAVHEAGLVHRDVKAQNVLRDPRGRVVLGDFGTGRELDDPAEPLTALAGTPAYVAPEIFRRQPATPQSDLYSLGALLFHLATGSYPVPGQSLRELRDAHETGRRIPLRSLRQDLPARLVDAIETALDLEPTRRFASAEAMARGLARSQPSARRRSRVAGGAIAIAALTSVLAAAFAPSNWFPGGADTRVLPFEARDWVLVTAFENRTGEPLLDGTLEYALEQELSNSKFIKVVPHGRVVDTLRLMLKPLDTRVDATTGREVALRDGQIRALVSGRFDKIGGSYSMRADVISPADGRVVASIAAGSVAQKELLDTVRRLALSIRERFGEALPNTQAAATLPKVTTSSLRALHLYAQAAAMEGEDLTWVGREAAAEQLLREAVREDPAFASAHMRLSIAARLQGRMPEALDHIERAVAVSDRASETERLIMIGERHWVRANVIAKSEEEWLRMTNQAVAAYEAALQLHPDHPQAAVCLTNVYWWHLRRPNARVATRLADQRPHSAIWQVAAATAILWADPRDRRGARPYMQRGAALPPDSKSAWWIATARVFEAYDAWLANRPREAMALAERLAVELPMMPPDVASGFAIQLLPLYSTLGAFRRALEMDAFVPHPWWRDLDALRVAGEREDREAVRTILEQRFRDYDYPKGQFAGIVPSMLVEAGLLKRAHEAVALFKSRNATRLVSLVEGQLSVAEGQYDAATAFLQPYLEQPTFDENMVWPLAAIKLAEAWVQKGDLSRAIDVLRAASERRFFLVGGTPLNGHAWLAVRDRLAQLYRKVGRVSDADAVEAELLALLEVADDDHPIKQRLVQATTFRK